MMDERAKTVKGVIDEHKRLVKVRKKTRPLNTRIPSLNPINKWYKQRGINIADVRRG
jgi:hypothetical protein